MEIRTFKEEIKVPYKNKNERVLKQLKALFIGIVLTMVVVAFYDKLFVPTLLLMVISIVSLFIYVFYNFDYYLREVVSEYKISDNKICITHALCMTSKGKFRRIQKVFYFSDIKYIEYEEDYRRVTIFGKGAQRIYKVNEYGEDVGFTQPETKECVKDEFYMKPSSYERLKKSLKRYENITFSDYFI